MINPDIKARVPDDIVSHDRGVGDDLKQLSAGEQQPGAGLSRARPRSSRKNTESSISESPFRIKGERGTWHQG